MLYEDANFWNLDRSHQGITRIDYGPEWDGYLGARLGIIERSGLMADGEALRFFEIGCSEGMLLKALKDKGHYAEGCEMNPSVVEAGRARLGVTIHMGMFETMPDAEIPFDRIVTFHTLEHLNDPHAVLTKCVRMLADDGALLVEVPTGAEDFNTIYHVQFFERDSLRRLLEQYFQQVEILDNHYTDPDGTVVQSLYGIGRTPRREPE